MAAQLAGSGEVIPKAVSLRPVYTTLTIIIPVFNERGSILEVLQTVLRQPVEGLAREIVLVDDFSTDGTREFLESLDFTRLCRPPDTIRLVLHDKNRGKGAGIRSALAASTGELVLMQDADFEYDPARLPRAPAAAAGRPS